MRSLILITLVAALWVFLGSTLEWVSAIAGLLMGALTFFWLRGSLLSRVFITEGANWRRPIEILMAAVRYAYLVVLANGRVAYLILCFRRSVRPVILRIHTKNMGDVNQTILANSITLTPGTISVDYSVDREYLYVHVLDAENIEEAREKLHQHIEIHFERGLRW